VDERVGTGLVRYEAMCHAIESAYEVDEVKDIHDRAQALELYERLAKNVEAEDRCYQIRWRAANKAGELLKVMEKAKPGGDMRPGIGRQNLPMLQKPSPSLAFQSSNRRTGRGSPPPRRASPLQLQQERRR
jgi:hypothetical protein